MSKILRNLEVPYFSQRENTTVWQEMRTLLSLEKRIVWKPLLVKLWGKHYEKTYNGIYFYIIYNSGFYNRHSAGNVRKQL